MLKASLAGLFAYLILFLIFPDEKLQKMLEPMIPTQLFVFLSAAFLLLAICYLYLYFIQIMDRSPATRIMVELENSSGKGLSMQQIKDAYSFEKKITDELEDMVILGRLTKEGRCFKLTDKGIKHLAVFKYVRNYLGLRRS